MKNLGVTLLLLILISCGENSELVGSATNIGALSCTSNTLNQAAWGGGFDISFNQCDQDLTRQEKIDEILDIMELNNISDTARVLALSDSELNDLHCQCITNN